MRRPARAFFALGRVYEPQCSHGLVPYGWDGRQHWGERVEKPIEFAPGERIGSRSQFEIVGKLSEGGTSIVYVAKADHGATVAVKLLRPERQLDSKALEAFRHEIRVRTKIANDVTEPHDVYFLAPLYKGRSLREHLVEQIAIHGSLRGPQCIQIFIDIATYLAAFENDVVHGDMKPENVLLEPCHGGYRARILDYGAARLDLDIDRGVRAGTAQYEAPEVCRTRAVDYDPESVAKITPAADVYAVGIMLHECYAGVAPFRHEDPDEVRRMHMDDDPDFDLLRRKNCPKPMIEIIRGCLQKEAGNRWSARHVANALRRLIAANEIKDTDGGPKDDELQRHMKPGHDRDAATRRLLYAGFALVLASSAFVAVRAWAPPKQAPVTTRAFPVVAAKLASSTPLPALIAAAPKRVVRKGSVPRPLTPAEIERQCQLVKGTDYACVPGGRFSVGATDTTVDELCRKLGVDCVPPVRELLLRAVPEDGVPLDTWVSTFAMMRHSVTCEDYADWMDSIRQDPDFAVESEHEGEDGAEPRLRYPLYKGKRIYDLFAKSSCIVRDPVTKRLSAIPTLAHRPVELVPWSSAAAYCTDNHGSLPTEAQFMRVRLWKTPATFVWGEKEPSCALVAFDQPESFNNDDHVHYGECRGLPLSQKGTRDVGSSVLDVVAGLGISDLSANVRQWALDGFVEHLPPCTGGVCIDPVMPPQPSGRFVMMGGSWTFPRWYLYSIFRGQYKGDSNEYGSGFRCVKNLPTRRAS